MSNELVSPIMYIIMFIPPIIMLAGFVFIIYKIIIELNKNKETHAADNDKEI